MTSTSGRNVEARVQRRSTPAHDLGAPVVCGAQISGQQTTLCSADQKVAGVRLRGLERYQRLRPTQALGIDIALYVGTLRKEASPAVASSLGVEALCRRWIDSVDSTEQSTPGLELLAKAVRDPAGFGTVRVRTYSEPTEVLDYGRNRAPRAGKMTTPQG